MAVHLQIDETGHEHAVGQFEVRGSSGAAAGHLGDGATADSHEPRHKDVRASGRHDAVSHDQRVSHLTPSFLGAHIRHALVASSPPCCLAPSAGSAPTNAVGWSGGQEGGVDRKSTRLNSSLVRISYAVFCLKKKNTTLTYPYSTLKHTHPRAKRAATHS